MTSAFKTRLLHALEAMGIKATQQQIGLFAHYHRLLLEWNERMDLTAVLEEDEMIDRHYVDSASPLRGDFIGHGAQVVDVGTGAGFPGIPLAILRPDITVTLLDALAKRCAFLEAVTEALSLPCRVVHGRAEDAGRDAVLREGFDVVLSRAVAPLSVLLEYTLPLARVGGRAIAFKGPNVGEEWAQGERAANALGGALTQCVRTDIPGRPEWQHQLVICEKQRKTPRAYPRKAGTPKREPLG